MSKRRAMTGKDVDRFPNFLAGVLAESAANTFTTTQVFTPLPRIKTSGTRATVMELLFVETDFSGTNIQNANGEQMQVVFSFGSAPTAMLAWNDTRNFFQRQDTIVGQAISTNGAGSTILREPVRYDWQSQDGYGYLLASDSFHVSVLGASQGAALSLAWKMFYRFVDIPLSEFVGIVQSTQQS